MSVAIRRGRASGDGFRTAHGDAFALGDVSFHGGWLFHRAGPNTAQLPRAVMTIIYMDAAMRLAQPANRLQEKDWQCWCEGAVISEMIDTPANLVLYVRNQLDAQE